MQVYALNALYAESKEAQGWGSFGQRHIKGKPLEAPIKAKLSSPNKVSRLLAPVLAWTFLCCVSVAPCRLCLWTLRRHSEIL